MAKLKLEPYKWSHALEGLAYFIRGTKRKNRKKATQTFQEKKKMHSDLFTSKSIYFKVLMVHSRAQLTDQLEFETSIKCIFIFVSNYFQWFRS